MSLFSRLKSVVTGDDYLDEGEYDDDLEYGGSTADDEPTSTIGRSSALTPIGTFDTPDSFIGSNVIGMPGISTSAAEVIVMEPRSF
ncbi:MAG: cell division protein SepF, partial [Cyanobacteriota bacterium]|nr:cell division protein SepF [Cyanobacteriota bacterium]